MMKYLISILLILMPAQLLSAGEVDIHITKAWMRPVILENRPTAIYFTMENNTNEDDRLTKAVSAMASRIEIHTHKNDDGIMRMMQVADIPVAAHSIVKIAPGGYHLMVFGLSMKFGPGDEFPLVLTFANAGRVTAVAKVMKSAP